MSSLWRASGGGFVAFNPNSKIPALLDRSGTTPVRVFESGAILRWTDQIALRPAVQRGRMVNRTWGEPSSQLHERHDAGDFDTKPQDKLAVSQ